MSINIELDPAIVQKLRERTAKLGKSLDEYILDLVQKELSQDTDLSREEFLLQKVNMDITSEKWEHYYELIEGRNKEVLSSEEHKELIEVSNEIEEQNAKRLPFIFELAQLRKITPEKLIADLGLQ